MRLTADDGALSAFDELTVTVNVNQAPVVGAERIRRWMSVRLALPAVANLSGTVTDDGLPTRRT